MAISISLSHSYKWGDPAPTFPAAIPAGDWLLIAIGFAHGGASTFGNDNRGNTYSALVHIGSDGYGPPAGTFGAPSARILLGKVVTPIQIGDYLVSIANAYNGLMAFECYQLHSTVPGIFQHHASNSSAGHNAATTLTVPSITTTEETVNAYAVTIGAVDDGIPFNNDPLPVFDLPNYVAMNMGGGATGGSAWGVSRRAQIQGAGTYAPVGNVTTPPAVYRAALVHAGVRFIPDVVEPPEGERQPFNLHGRFAGYHLVTSGVGTDAGIRFRWAPHVTPPFAAQHQVTTLEDDEYPRLALDERKTLHLVNENSGTIYERTSTDTGATWSAAVSLFTGAQFPTIAQSPHPGGALIAAAREVSTGRLLAKRRYPGDTDWSAEFELLDPDEVPLVIDTDVFHLSAGLDGARSWVLVVRQDDEIVHWVSYDEADTFAVVT